MMVEITSAGLRTRGMTSFSDRQASATLFYPERYKEVMRFAAGISIDQAERRCFERRIPTVRVEQDHATITADYMGMHHLYVREYLVRDEMQVRIADDPFEFAEQLDADLDVLKLVASLKFIPLPLSCVRGTTRMMPGTQRIYDLCPVRLRAERNKLFETFHADIRDVSPSEIRSTLHDVLTTYIADQQNAHVFLSGGMDSALLVFLLRNAGLPVQAWTATFNSALGRLEAHRAESSARYLGASIKVVDIQQTGRDPVTPILALMREPFADVATVAESVLAEYASSRGAGVVYEGEGVDSLMGGSYKFVVERYREVIRALTNMIPGFALRNASRKTAVHRAKLKIRQMKSLSGATGTDFERHFQFLTNANTWPLLAKNVRDAAEAAFRFYYDVFDNDRVNKLAAMTFWGNIPNLENRKLELVERYSGVRFNLIFQDIRFIRMAFSLSFDRKVRRGYGKWCMREAFRNALPPHTLTRKKLSFVPPVLDQLSDNHYDILLDGSIFGTANTERMLAEHKAGTDDHLSSIWAVLVTNSWLRRYREKAARADLAPTGIRRGEAR